MMNRRGPYVGGGKTKPSNDEKSKSTRIFKLIIQPDQHSVNVLKYINSTITTLMRMGVRFKIIKINRDDVSDSFVKELASINIVRLPLVITDDNRQWVGYKEIKSKIYSNIKLFEQNTQTEHELNQQLDDDPTGLGRLMNKKGMDLNNNGGSFTGGMNSHLNDELKYLKHNGDKTEFMDDSDEDEMGENNKFDIRKATEEQAKKRKMSLDTGKKQSKSLENMINVQGGGGDGDEPFDFNPRTLHRTENKFKQFNGKNNNNLDNVLDKEDIQLMDKSGGGGDDDGELLYRQHAMLNDRGGDD